MAYLEVLVNERTLFKAGSLAGLIRIVEREGEQWSKVFPSDTPQFFHTGERLQPKYTLIAKHLESTGLSKLDIVGQPHFEVFPPYSSPEGLAIRNLAASNRTKELASLIQYWRIECRWTSEALLDHRDEGGRAVRSAQVTMSTARAVALQISGTRELSQAIEAANRLEAQIVGTEAAAEAFRKSMEVRELQHQADIENSLKREERRQRALRKHEKLLIAGWKERFEATHQSYVQKLQFEAPVKLWSTAAASHKKRARLAFWSFFALSALAASSAILLAVLFGDELASAYVGVSCDPGIVDCNARLSPKGPLITGAILLAASFAVWMLRTINRIYQSERNLGLAAEERKAFAETYLALIADQSVTRDQEAIVMAALFRPSGDGSPGDDGSGLDFSSAAVLAKVLSGPRP